MPAAAARTASNLLLMKCFQADLAYCNAIFAMRGADGQIRRLTERDCVTVDMGVRAGAKYYYWVDSLV